MKADVIVIGAELDAFAAAGRLTELGRRVSMIAPGDGSLAYTSAGIRVLGYLPSNSEEPVVSPVDALERLGGTHPYRLLGAERVRHALDWFLGFAETIGCPHEINGGNAAAITPTGGVMPTYATARHQATMAAMAGNKVVVVRFRRHRDFPADLLLAGLAGGGVDATIVDIDAPGAVVENAGIARSLDRLTDRAAYFQNLRTLLPDDTGVVLFPAVMGLQDHATVMADASVALGLPCFEVPTIPPSVPGLRLQAALRRRLAVDGVSSQGGSRVSASNIDGRRCVSIADDAGHDHVAPAFIVATGGILMGGLDVSSEGLVMETAMNLAVHQSKPLDARTVDASLHALHGAGVEVGGDLRPVGNGKAGPENVFVTGRTLAHWNPGEEVSTEGVAIATGWAAAESANAYLKEAVHE